MRLGFEVKCRLQELVLLVDIAVLRHRQGFMIAIIIDHSEPMDSPVLKRKLPIAVSVTRKYL